MGSSLSRGSRADVVDVDTAPPDDAAADSATPGEGAPIIALEGPTTHVKSATHVQTVRMVSPVTPGPGVSVRPVFDLSPVYVVEEKELPPPRDLAELYHRVCVYLSEPLDPGDTHFRQLPEQVEEMVQASTLTFLTGWAVAGLYYSMKGMREFKETNRNTIFKSQAFAYRESNWAAMEGIFLRGLPVGVKLMTMTAMVLGGSAVIGVYRQKNSFMNTAAAGGVTGFVWSVPYGFTLCRLATGTGFVAGGMAGALMSGLKELEELVMTDEVRQARAEEKAHARQQRIDRVLSRYQVTDSVIAALEAASTNVSDQQQASDEGN